MKLLADIGGVALRLDDDGVIRFTADADIDSDGGPNVDADPCWQPETTLRHQGRAIDAQRVPYAVIPIGILNQVGPVGLGCQVVVSHLLTGRSCQAVLADLGPARKIGEISPALARRIGVNPHSVLGGESRRVIRYEVHIGVPAVVDGVAYRLQPLRVRR